MQRIVCSLHRVVLLGLVSFLHAVLSFSRCSSFMSSSLLRLDQTLPRYVSDNGNWQWKIGNALGGSEGVEPSPWAFTMRCSTVKLRPTEEFRFQINCGFRLISNSERPSSKSAT